MCEIVKEISNHECKFLPTYNEIDSENFNVKVGEREDDSVRFLYVGRLSHVKGVDLLIEALNQFKNNFHTNFKCNIVGDGDLFESLNELVIKYKLENNVSFLGRITDSLKLSEIFTNADCLIIPSRSESIPIVLCEALQFNLPMIVSNVGDMGKIVNENKLGYVVSNTNAQYFSNVINDFICNPIVLDKTIIETTLNKLTFKHNSNLLLDVLNKLNHEY